MKRQKIPPIQLNTFKKLLRPRQRNAHKGLFGHVLIIGGELGWGGAVCLASEAALRIGAGLVSVATKKENISAILTRCPEVMAHEVKKIEQLRALIAKSSVIVIGPGLGQNTWAKQLWKIVQSAEQPKVVDADALNLLTKHRKKSKNWILTPHPGEASRLLACDVDSIQSNRLKAAERLQQIYGGVIVLKGANTLVCGENSLKMSHSGNPGMASGGMGDVLTGIIGGLIAQGLTLIEAAELAVSIHGQAADQVAAEKGERGMLAHDLMPALQKLVNQT